MEETAFAQWLWEGGQVAIPLRLLEKIDILNLSPEDVGCLVLALARSRQRLTAEELAQDKWIKWSLTEGWSKWQGHALERTITFAPLWDKLYEIWSANRPKENPRPDKQEGDFDYSRILKWLDQQRGTLSVTLREKQVIQEFNLKYGWSTEFILIFLQLVFERGYTKLPNYYSVAKKVYESGANTVDELVSFINNLDWIHYKVTEIKNCIGQYGGVTRPQREMYLKWQNKWKFSHEVILRASDETVRTNNPSFKYIDAILQDWYNKGVKDIKDAENLLQSRDRPKGRIPDKRRISRIDKRDWENI